MMYSGLTCSRCGATFASESLDDLCPECSKRELLLTDEERLEGIIEFIRRMAEDGCPPSGECENYKVDDETNIVDCEMCVKDAIRKLLLNLGYLSPEEVEEKVRKERVSIGEYLDASEAMAHLATYAEGGFTCNDDCPACRLIKILKEGKDIEKEEEDAESLS